MNSSNTQNIAAWDLYDEMDAFGDDGDLSRQYILTPAIYKELGDIDGKTILDAGCGTGYLSRKLVKEGAIVTGVEPSKNLFNYCTAREQKENLGIDYFQQDISKLELTTKFDYVVANMVLQDIFLYKDAIKKLVQVLKPKGKLIFSILHPMFDENVNAKGYLNNYSIKQKFGKSYHRTVEQYSEAIRLAVGCILKILEPKPIEEAKNIKELEPDFLNPNFMFFVVEQTKDRK